MQTRTVKTDKPRGVVRPGGRFVHHHDGNKYIGDRAAAPQWTYPGPGALNAPEEEQSYDVVRAKAMKNDATK